MVMEFQNIAIVKVKGSSHLRIFFEQGFVLNKRRCSLANLFIGIKNSIDGVDPSVCDLYSSTILQLRLKNPG